MKLSLLCFDTHLFLPAHNSLNAVYSASDAADFTHAKKWLTEVKECESRLNFFKLINYIVCKLSNEKSAMIIIISAE